MDASDLTRDIMINSPPSFVFSSAGNFIFRVDQIVNYVTRSMIQLDWPGKSLNPLYDEWSLPTNWASLLVDECE